MSDMSQQTDSANPQQVDVPEITLEQIEYDLQVFGWKYERRKDEHGEHIVFGFPTEPDKATVMVKCRLSGNFVWFMTQNLVLYVTQEKVPVLLGANKQLPMGKLYLDMVQSEETKNQPVASAEYGFELPFMLYHQQVLFAYLRLMVQNLDWLMNELLKNKVFDNRHIALMDPNIYPPVQDSQAPQENQPMQPVGQSVAQPEYIQNQVTQPVDDSQKVQHQPITTDPQVDQAHAPVAQRNTQEQTLYSRDDN